MVFENFSDRDGSIWFNGRLVPWRDANSHIMNQGLHYGMAVFEGERTYGGRIFRLTEHSMRLAASARAMGYEIPYSTGEIEMATMQAIKAADLQEGYVRAFAWPGSRYMDLLPRDNEVNLAIAVWSVQAGPDAKAKAKGLRLKVSAARRPNDSALPGTAKSAASWAIGSISRGAAVKAGYDDALMLDCDGHIAGTTGANIFFVIDGTVHTPKPNAFFAGITRRTVIQLFRQRQIDVYERFIDLAELDQVQEAFITGTATEVTPVTSIESRRMAVGNFCRIAMQDYYDLARSSGELIT
ncbi:aminotransferase class IV [Agrobacterium fabrum]|uniref:aminotransferase class IV n=1 Tax=Agrobacterium fabrum TaxID=1176649 RepID=UPI001572D9FC|nr:aminotransferase class IV [Agrobacterium fabrum]WCK80088.1 aminotransferase class IV [Agrobacterium fabrum]